jgi:hypothetical protein
MSMTRKLLIAVVALVGLSSVAFAYPPRVVYGPYYPRPRPYY